MLAPAVRPSLKSATCRFCGTPLNRTFANLGVTPPSNAYLREADLSKPEIFYPLHAYVCESCLLVQLEEFATPEQIFTDYAYFSSYSETWLRHAEDYAAMAAARFRLGADSRVVEIASNDGYLLQFFARRGIPVRGVEPAANVARRAEAIGVPTLVRFFGRATARKLAQDHGRADLLIANNVLAHVPNLNDFVAGLRIALAPEGTVTVEVPHLMRLIEQAQFDTIYHEHFSYFSFVTAERIFAAHGLTVFDVESLTTHGGSLRLYAAHTDAGRAPTQAVLRMRAAERIAGLDSIAVYEGFGTRVARIKRDFMRFLIDAKDVGKTIAGYGAAAKGNTLLVTAGVGPDLIDYVVDANPHKQGLFLPGSHIPILPPERLRETRPDYIVILPWNLKTEIVEVAACAREWGARFVVAVPELTVLP
jgi:2-polyprenyl-3-methyl-5-hydroxy-6-metoxy-1,4-benzoquinol methylase